MKKLIFILIVGLAIGMVGCGHKPELKTENAVTEKPVDEKVIKEKPSHAITIDFFRLLRKAIALHYQRVISDSWCGTLSAFILDSELDDIESKESGALVGAKWYWKRNAPFGGYLYGALGYGNMHVDVEHTNTHDELSVFMSDFGIGYSYSPDEKKGGLLDFSIGVLTSDKEDKWTSEEGNSLRLNRSRIKIMIKLGFSF